MIIKDQLKRELHIKEVPKRIISLVPSQTELLVDLGLEDSIVGITKFCVHPKHLRKQKTIVGGTKNIKLKKIQDLQPDIILCNKEENSKEIIESLLDIAPIHISDIYNLEDNFELFEMYGELFQVKEKAIELTLEIKNQRKIFKDFIHGKPKIKASYFIWKNPWMVAASNTFINTMLNEAGFINAFESETRYPNIDLNHNANQESEVLLLSSEPFPFKEKQVLELKSKFPNKKVIIVDGELFSWYGSRLLQSYSYFKSLHDL